MSLREHAARLAGRLPVFLRPERSLDRHMAPVLTVVFLGVLLSTVAAYFYSKRTVEELAWGQTVQTAGFLDREIAARIQEITFDVSVWSREEVYRLALEDSYLGVSARATAERKLATLNAHKAYDRLFLALPSGEVVAASLPDMVGAINVADRSYFRRSMNGQQAMETLRSGKYSGLPVLVASAPLAAPDSTVQGVLVAVIDIGRFAGALMDQARIGQNGAGYVLDQKGALVAAAGWVKPEHFPPEAVVEEILLAAEERRPVRYERGDSPRLALSRRNQITGWTLVVEADEDEVLRPARQQATIGGLISFLTLALVALALGVLRRTMNSLQKSEERSRTLTELSPVGILTCDGQGVLTYANDQARQVLGLGDEGAALPAALALCNAQGQPLPDEENPVLLALNRGVRITGRLAWHTLPGGEVRVLSVSAAPLKALGAAAGVVIALEDVTERRRTIDALLNEKRFTEALLDGLPGIFYVYDKNLRLVRWNRNHELATGFGPEELRGRHLGQWHASEQGRARAMEATRRVLYEERHGQIEGTLRHKDGTAVPYLLTGVRLDTPDGPMMLGVGFDISERREAEERVRASEEKYRAIFNNSPVGIFRTTVSGRFLEANPTLARMLGYGSREELLESVTDLARDIYPSEAERRRLLDALEQSPGGVSMEIEFKRRDGTPFYAIIHASMHPGEDGGPALLDGTIEDISERRLAEDRLRQSERKFAQLFRLSPDSINLLDRQTGRVVDANEAFLQHLGLSREQVVGHTREEIGLLVDPVIEREIELRLQRDGVVSNVEVPSAGAEGRNATMSLSLQVVEIDGRDYVLCIARDITDIKRMQEVMVQTEKMISVGGIAAGIAHEINNPLGIVLQGAQTLAQRVNPEFSKNQEVARALGLDLGLLDSYLKARKVDTFIEDIQSAAMRASAIIRHMLDFSRKSESRRNFCDMADIMEKAVNLAMSDYDLKKNYDFRKIEIVREYAADVPQISCTETEIEQVLLNLLRNAAQAMASVGEPAAAPRIVLRLGPGPLGVRAEVEDNGPGMPAEVRRRIFEPFYTTKGPGVGTGLGLSVSYFIVTKGHGGAMAVESEPGQGTRFLLDLPAGESAGGGQ